MERVSFMTVICERCDKRLPARVTIRRCVRCKRYTCGSCHNIKTRKNRSGILTAVCVDCDGAK